MAFKLIVQNSKIVLKSVANYIINASGIKDLLTGTSNVDTNGKIDWTLQHYADTAANFTSANPTLLVGQIGIETDNLLTTPKFKIGDGANDWNTLPYANSTSGGTWGSITGTLSNQTDLQTALNAKEDTANKSTNLNTDQASNTKYPSVKAVYDWATGLFVKSVEGVNVDNTDAFNPKIPIPLPIDFSINAYGDSITLGFNSTSSPLAYINLLGTLYGKTVYNRAVSGMGIWESTRDHLYDINSNNSVLSVVMAGLNDVRRGGSNSKTNSKILNGYKSIIANQFLQSFIPAGQTSTYITRSGSWNNTYLGTTVGCKTDTGSYSNTSSGYIEYTFTGSNVVLGLVAGDGVTQIHADFNVSIDGVSQGSYTENNQTDGISDGSYDNARSAMCLIFTGLTNTSHTIRLTNTTSNYLIVDYFGHLKEPKFCSPLLIMNVPKLDATGYSIAPNLANDTIINNLNSDLDNLVNFLPDYPIYIGKTNNYYNVSTGLDTDHIHPNDIGHYQIYCSAKEALRYIPFLGKIYLSTLTASKIVETDASKNLTSSSYSVSDLALKSNNLSDLANPLTARNNLKIWDLFLTGGNQSTTSNVATNITDLVSPTLTASKRYRIHGVIKVGCNNTGGIRFQITLPSGASMDISLSGSNTSNTAYINATITSSATLSAQVNSFNGLSMLRVDGEISLGVTAGTIQFGFASGTNTQTSTVYQLGTHLTVTQIN